MPSPPPSFSDRHDSGSTDEAHNIMRTPPNAGLTRRENTVFVVHGRNDEARKALFDFLRSIGLQPLEWSQAVHATGKAAPYIGEILDTAFQTAQAIIVLLTGDDEARLQPTLHTPGDGPAETMLQPQARPNVLFEAGMAFGYRPNQTVIAQLGAVKTFSDVAGRHVLHLNNTSGRRKDLTQRLQGAGCAVDISGNDWLTTGNFDIPPPAVIVDSNPTSRVTGEALRLLDALATNPDRFRRLGDLTAALNIPHARAERFLNELVEYGYAVVIPVLGGGNEYRITVTGRGFAAGKKLALATLVPLPSLSPDDRLLLQHLGSAHPRTHTIAELAFNTGINETVLMGMLQRFWDHDVAEKVAGERGERYRLTAVGQDLARRVRLGH